MPQMRLRVAGMGCPRCVREVTKWLRDVPGVETITADAVAGEIVLSGSMSRDEVMAVVRTSPFDATEVLHDAPSPDAAAPTA